MNHTHQTCHCIFNVFFIHSRVMSWWNTGLGLNLRYLQRAYDLSGEMGVKRVVLLKDGYEMG